jgi:hypothetical protein
MLWLTVRNWDHERVTLYTRSRLNRCRYNRVRLQIHNTLPPFALHIPVVTNRRRRWLKLRRISIKVFIAAQWIAQGIARWQHSQCTLLFYRRQNLSIHVTVLRNFSNSKRKYSLNLRYQCASRPVISESRSQWNDHSVKCMLINRIICFWKFNDVNAGVSRRFKSLFYLATIAYY